MPSQWSTNPPFPAIVACLAVFAMSAVLLHPTIGNNIHDLGGILTAWNFFKKRFDFIQDQFKKSGGKMFGFNVLQASLKLTKSSQMLTCRHSSIGW
jgi:sterol 14-demethylase